MPKVALAILGLGIGVTIATGSWIGGVPELIRSELGGSAADFSIVMIGYALGSVAAGLVLARWTLGDKATASLWAWSFGLPAFLLLSIAHTVPVAAAGGFAAGIAQSSAVLLVTSAAQTDAPDAVLGRVMGLVTLVHRGGHATALLLVAPLYAWFPMRHAFAAAAVALALLSMSGVIVVRRSAAAAGT
jgi:hypothetical protein